MAESRSPLGKIAPSATSGLGRRELLMAAAGAGAAMAFRTRPSLADDGESWRHGIARHGEPLLPPDFTHLPYAHPTAPRQGRLVLGALGTFDSMNPFIARGAVPEGLTGQVIQPLMMRSLDEPFTLYGLVAEAIQTDRQRRFARFRLRSEARFADDVPITADDISFTAALLRERGRPFHRAAFRRLASTTVEDARTIRFTFTEPDAELPLILGLMPVLARHATDPTTFEQPTYRPPLSSGPYLVAELDPGRSFTLRRNPNFWGAHLPVLRGHHNVDEIRVDYYRDANALFEAFRTGRVDLRVETDPGRWLDGYEGPALEDGRMVREGIALEAAKGMTGIVFNTRRAPLDDQRIREALIELFDFEWLNRHLFRGIYRRQASFFDQSELASTGRPASAGERRILGPHLATIAPSILDGTWRPPVSDGSGRDRQRRQAALQILAQRGFEIRQGRMRGLDGTPLDFELLVLSREQERIGLAFADQLRPLGIGLSIRFVDSSIYWRRLRTFDFDSIIWSYSDTPSPGAEQPNRFGSAAAGREASLNYAGVRSPAVDAALDAMREAEDRPAFVDAVRALDRALLSGSYILPLYFAPERWLARWRRVRRPERSPRMALTFETFWVEPEPVTTGTTMPRRP